MRVVKHLPFLIHYYRWLHQNFTATFTEEEATEKTIWDVIMTLPKEHHRHFAKLKQIWEECRDTLMVVACGGAGDNAAGFEIPELTEKFRFRDLLTHDIADKQEYDKLWYTLNELRGFINEIYCSYT